MGNGCQMENVEPCVFHTYAYKRTCWNNLYASCAAGATKRVKRKENFFFSRNAKEEATVEWAKWKVENKQQRQPKVKISTSVEAKWQREWNLPRRKKYIYKKKISSIYLYDLCLPLDLGSCISTSASWVDTFFALAYCLPSKCLPFSILKLFLAIIGGNFRKSLVRKKEIFWYNKIKCEMDTIWSRFNLGLKWKW